MALTYSPFSETHSLDELDHELHMNIPNGERVLFGLTGAGLILFAGKLHGLPQWLLLTAGAAMMRRGWRGYSPCYAHLEVDPRHHRRGPSARVG